MKTIEEIIKYIIPRTLELNSLYLPNEKTHVNYSAIFCQSDEEFKILNTEAKQFGLVIENTPTGPLYKLTKPIETMAGPLWLLKVRKPDIGHPQRGDADFTLEKYLSFKNEHLSDSQHFSLIEREKFEMIELKDPQFDVLSYFSNPPLTVQYDIEE